MRRYSPGIYTIVNRNGFDTRKEYFLDDQRYELYGDAMLTIFVYDNLYLTEDAYYKCEKVGTIPGSVVGNMSVNQS